MNDGQLWVFGVKFVTRAGELFLPKAARANKDEAVANARLLKGAVHEMLSASTSLKHPVSGEPLLVADVLVELGVIDLRPMAVGVDFKEPNLIETANVVPLHRNL